MLGKLRWLWLLAAPALAGGLPAAAPPGAESVWVFEGVITEADPALAPDLQSGWVLSGSFAFAPIELEEVTPPADGRSGRLSGGIRAAELTIDLYHQAHFSALQAPGMAGFDYRKGDPEDDGRDLLGWFLPMHGRLKESGWSSRWLQVWLADPDGRMLRGVPPRIPPRGLDWKQAWFRLTFVNAAGDAAYAEGPLDVFAPEDTVARDDALAWMGVATRLGDQLRERDAQIASLREELDQARARLDSLRRMVDLLVEERTELQRDNALLREAARRGDPAREAAFAELAAEKALLEEELADLTQRQGALAETLAASERERRQLLRRIEELESAVPPPPAGEPAPKTPLTAPLYYSGQPVGTITIAEEPVVVEKPVLPPAGYRDFPHAPPRPRRLVGPPRFR